MFVLLGNGSIFKFPKDGKYLIGRHVGDIIIGNSTISRKHAEIEIINGQAFLQDCNSKYFTKYKGKVLLANEKVKLEDGAVIIFGEVEFSFKAIEKFVTCSTGVKDNEGELRSVIESLGGEYLKEWNETCTHLTTCEIMVTLKVLHAIMDNKKIVTPEFWKTYFNNISSNKLPPNPSEFYPPLGESMIQSKYLEYNPNRKNIFLNKTFAFWKKKRQLSMNEIISKAGGKSLFILATIKTKSNIELLKLMDNCIVMDPEDANIVTTYSAVLDAYKGSGRRIIPIQEIVLAILQCSCDENCNPHFDRAKTVFIRDTLKPDTSKIVVGETECFQIDSEKEQKPEVVPSSFNQEEYLNIQVGNDKIENKLVPSTSKRSREVVPETQVAKKIKLEAEVLDIPTKKKCAPMFRRPAQEPLELAEKKSKSKPEMKLNPFSAMGLKMNQRESGTKDVVDLDLTNNPFGQIQLRKDLKKENLTNDIIVIDDNTSYSKNYSSKKRKSEDILDSTISKKRTKIIIKKNRKFIEVASIQFSNLSHNISSGTWLNSNIKEELKSTPLKLDDEEQKWCERFNNSVVIVAKDLWRKDKENKINFTGTSNQTNVKNFKKFRKIPVPKSGQVIKCSKIVYGHSNLGIDYPHSDDEDNRKM